jgi:alpha-D-xyloside xylohydrolase
VPWAYDDESVAVVKFFTRLKASLMPYLFRNAIETSKIGIPSMRSMVMEYTSDLTCAYLDKQYILGDSLLVAPIFNDEGIANYYLPEGKWTDFFTGEVKTGSRWYKEKHSYLSIPLMVKEGSIIAVGAMDSDAVYDYAEGVTLRAYELLENVPSTTVVYDNKTKLSLHAEIVKYDKTISIEVNAAKNYKVVLVNVSDIASVDNGNFLIKGNDTEITPNRKGKIICNLN